MHKYFFWCIAVFNNAEILCYMYFVHTTYTLNDSAVKHNIEHNECVNRRHTYVWYFVRYVNYLHSDNNIMIHIFILSFWYNV
jgi:hypothetical protein